jgi:hypothetical protein
MTRFTMRCMSLPMVVPFLQEPGAAWPDAVITRRRTSLALSTFELEMFEQT